MNRPLWKHIALVGVVAALVGLFNVLPSLALQYRLGDDFAGIWPPFNGDTLYYLSRVREVRDGFPAINHPYFSEHKTAIYPQATGAERLMALLAGVFHVEVVTLHVWFEFLAPAIICTLLYIVLYALYPRRWSALVLAALLTTVIPGGLLKPIHPMVSMPLLLVFLWAWIRQAQQPTLQWRYVWIGGIALGSLFLTYFYHWSFVVVVLGMYAMWRSIERDWRSLKPVAAMAVIGIVIGLPYFLLVYQGMGAPYADETAVRVGLYHTRWPETIPRLAVALVWLGAYVAAVRAFSLRHERTTGALGALLAANVLYPNYQVISGFLIQNANHWSYMPIVLYALSAHYLVQRVWAAPPVAMDRTWYSVLRQRWIWIAAVVVLFAVPAARLSSFNVPGYLHNLQAQPRDSELQRYAPLFVWLQREMPKESVVFTDARLTEYLPVYTSANVYHHPYAFNLPASDEEVVDRALLAHMFDPEFFTQPRFGMNEDARILWTQPAQSERNAHRIHRQLGWPYEQEFSLERETAFVAERYASLQRAGWNPALLGNYRLDYLVWDRLRRPGWNVDRYPQFERVGEVNDFVVYRFNL